MKTNSKLYRLLNPLGVIVSGINVSELARREGLNGGALRQVANGNAEQHKGWRLAR